MILSYAMMRTRENSASIFVVAIDGHGGSGKSTLAQALAERLGAEIIHTDDFASWDNPVNWWPLVIEHVFEPIAQGARTLNYPRSKWWEDHHPEPAVDQPVTPILILEGVTALRKEFRPYVDFGVFVETPVELCLQRGFERDRGMDGKADEEIRAMWRAWLAAEDAYLARDDPQSHADKVVEGTRALDEVVSDLAASIAKRAGA